MSALVRFDERGRWHLGQDGWFLVSSDSSPNGNPVTPPAAARRSHLGGRCHGARHFSPPLSDRAACHGPTLSRRDFQR